MKLDWSHWTALVIAVLSYLAKRKGDRMSGIDELTKLVDLVVDAIQDGVAVMADGKVDFTDIAKFSNLVPDLIAAVPGLGQTPEEIKALTFDEGHALVTHVVAKLGVSNAKALAIIDASLKLAADAYALVIAIKMPA